MNFIVQFTDALLAAFPNHGALLTPISCNGVCPQVAQQLGRVAVVIEGHFDGVAQDIEGGLVGSGDNEQLYIFQTRPQV